MSQLSPDVKNFLQELVRHYALGSRGPEFAEWAATQAIFILEFRGLFPPQS
jgi:hypothetical protein